MSQLYPVYLKLNAQPVLMVGGGSLALQKIESLESAGPAIHVVAPRVDPAIAARALRGELHVSRRTYESADLQGARLVYAATDDAEVNHRVVAEARAAGILANAVDDPEHCDFYTPSIIRRGPVSFAISSEGAFPGITKALREGLEAWLPDEDTDLLADLMRLRDEMRRHPDAQRREALRELIARFRRDYLHLDTEAAGPWGALAAGPEG